MSEAIVWPQQTRARAPERRAPSAASSGRPPVAPSVAVLCTPPRGRVVAAGVGLALARATGRPCALVGALGAGESPARAGAPAATRTASALQRHGVPARAGGRLVWLADRRGPLLTSDADVAARAAALSAEVGRSAAALGLSAAVAIPCARTEALDRVLAWYDAVVVVRDPDTPAAVIERALAGLTALGRPAAAMTPPARLPGILACAGLGVPAEATAAVAELALGGVGRTERRDG